METSPQVHDVGSHNVQVEVVTAQGQPVTSRPIRMEELLQQHDHTLDVGQGIALRLEELNAAHDYNTGSDDDDDSAGSGSESSGVGDSLDSTDDPHAAANLHDGTGGRRRPGHAASPPPGTHATNEWYDVLDALRREQQDVERTTAEVEQSRRKPRDGEGRLVTRNPNDQHSVATPLKRFSNAPSTDTKSIAGDRPASPAPGASRHDVWASLAPPKDKHPHNYNVLRYVSFMSALDYRRFRPTALAFHAAASYLNRKDRGQRLLVYGGVSFGAHKVEMELYEFSVLTGNWRRMEGRQLVPAGHYGHTMTVVEPLDRLVVVGGIGPGGAAVSKELRQAWTADALRAPRYQLLCPLLRRGERGKGSAAGVAAAIRNSHSNVAPLGIGAAARPAPQAAATIGFVPLLFDMNLNDLTWRAIQPAQPFPLAYHTAVHFEKEIFVFGGLTDELRVSGQLLAINPDTYAVRLITTSAANSVKSRRSRSASAHGSSGAAAGESDANTEASAAAKAAAESAEAAGPGPRFLHSCIRYGPFMVVFGGYNAHNEVLDDCWAFDMVNERWERLRCRGDVSGRAGHECCLVGCRIIVTGGFECSLEEMGTPAAVPATSVMELNLVPTTAGEHLWRSALKVHPALPPLAFTRCAPCGEDHSFVLFGGITRLPRRSRSALGVGPRSTSATRRRREQGSEDGSGESGEEGDHEGSDVDNAHGAAGDDEAHKNSGASAKAGHKGLLSRFAPFDDGLVFTFPAKPRRHARDADAPVVNALGVEVDPNELPEHFKTFVRRQEDFVKKKDATAVDIMRKTTLEEQEGMEPTLYLTDDEIDLLMRKSEECCVAFAQRYPMASLPSNVPDREERVHLIEECISESRQVRDVLKSMKGSAPGVTAVKSKSHRKRAGQKFEDYSAAKPFRRVVVVHLLESINSHLARMHRLNKALRTVDWEEKAEFLEAVDDMQNSVHAVSRAINGVLRKYIQHRVDSLMKGVDKHKEVMRLLTQVVEKNRHDKIWGVEEARDAQRHQTQHTKSRTTSQARGASTHANSPKPGGASKSGKSGAPPHVRPSRSRSLGGGYHADESKAVVYLMDKEWAELRTRTQAVERCAAQLQRYCRDGITGGDANGAGAATTTTTTATTATGDSAFVAPALPPAAAAATAETPLTVPGSGPLSLPLAPPTTLPPPPPSVPQVADAAAPTGLPLPAPLPVTPGVAVLPPSLPVAPPQAAPPQPPVPEAGAARPRDIMIRHSNELRGQTAAVAEEVAAAAAAFYTALTEVSNGEKDNAHSQENASSSSSSSAASGAAAPTISLPAPQLLAPPTLATPHASSAAKHTQNSDSGSSRSSSSSSASNTATTTTTASSSRSSSAAPPAQTAAAAAPVPAAPTSTVPPPATAGIAAPALPPAVLAAPQVPAVATAEAASVAAKSAEEGQQMHEQKAKKSSSKKVAIAASGPEAQATQHAGHALCLAALRPLLSAKESLLTMKDKVSLIRKNDWDGNDLAGAPQDAQVEALYRRLDRYITAVSQCVTANFLTKAGARPPRTRPAPSSLSVTGPAVAHTNAAKTAKRAVSSTGRGGSGGGKRSISHSSLPRHSAAVEAPGSAVSSHLPQHSPFPSSLLRGGAGAAGAAEVSASPTAAATLRCGTPSQERTGAAETLRLRPLPASAVVDAEDAAAWWQPQPQQPQPMATNTAAVAEAAAPLVPAEALLRDVRLDGAYNAAAAAGASDSAAVKIEAVFHDVRKVPNVSPAPSPMSPSAGSAVGIVTAQGPWSPAANRLPQSPGYLPSSSASAPAGISLSVVPKVVMPDSPDVSATGGMNGVNVGNGQRDSGGAPAASPTSLVSSRHPAQRRQSTIEELTQLAPPGAAPASLTPALGGGGGTALDTGLGPAAREPITSITGGNFAVNTEYLYRVAPQTIPATVAAGADGQPTNAFDPFNSSAARHAWADVDDDYFYFGRPVEKRVAVADNAVSGPPYVQMTPIPMAGQVSVSPPVGSIVGSQRVNAELKVAGRASSATKTRRSASGRRPASGPAGGYLSTTASQAQKSQTARPVRKDGTSAKSFYTPGELQLMQARERLRAKPQKH